MRRSLLLFVIFCLGDPVKAQLMESLSTAQIGSSMRASSGDILINSDSEQFQPGETKVVAKLKGPGVIKHIWLVPNASNNIRWPRAFVLRIYWDGADVPSVEVPFGDFFGSGNGMKSNINSLPVKVTSYGRALNCYWHMPFSESAKVTITYECEETTASCFVMIDWNKREEVIPNMMYFHARYHQDKNPKVGEPYTLLKAKGRGHYVGTVLSSHNAMGHWFGEGDDFVYIDGEELPSIYGTGTEDYFNEAWNMRVHSGLYTGCTIFEPRAPDARISAYRWHLEDPIIFNKSLLFELEKTGFVVDTLGNALGFAGSRPDHWSSVSFWYQDDIADPWCEFPEYKERIDEEIVIFFPKIIESIKHSRNINIKLNPYNRATYTKSWVQIENNRVGSWFEIPFAIEKSGKYSISLFQLLRQDNGIWKVYIDDKEIDVAGESHISGGYRVGLVNNMSPEQINKTLDFYNIYQKNEREDYIYGQRQERKIGLFNFNPGRHSIKFVCVGSNPLSAHPETGNLRYNFTADVVSIRLFPFENIDGWIEDVIEYTRKK